MRNASDPGTLYVVATPIGNLEDITLRALRILRRVGLVAAEDTRRTRVLLDRYRISVKVISYHDQNEVRRAPELIDALERGTDVALVSDAGTPCISDPGYRVLAMAAERGLEVVPVPGPSAVTAALSVAGLPVGTFTFIGFLPRKTGQREALLEEIAHLPGAVVMYEAPRRIRATLRDLARVLGAGRRAVMVREATKAFEDISRGTLGQLAERAVPRGEITLVLEATPDLGTGSDVPLPVHREVKLLEEWGISRSDAIRRVARGHGLPRAAVYKAVVAAKDDTG